MAAEKLPKPISRRHYRQLPAQVLISTDIIGTQTGDHFFHKDNPTVADSHRASEGIEAGTVARAVRRERAGSNPTYPDRGALNPKSEDKLDIQQRRKKRGW